MIWLNLGTCLIFTAATYVFFRAFVELLIRAQARSEREFGGRRLDRWT